MRTQRILNVVLFFFTLGLLASAMLLTACSKRSVSSGDSAVQSKAGVEPTKTLQNLQVAYNGESNARARYLAFAQKAEADGYGKVASLFRAAARAEEIHANNHSEVIRQLGGTPTAEIKAPEVGGTAENLDAAIKGESYERDTMYPDFLNQARQDGVKEAFRSFNLARNAEAEHAKLYSQARSNLNAWKGGQQTFYVCPTCGFTTSDLSFEKCPSSFTPRDKFLAIS
jgi:rubrerythrin